MITTKFDELVYKIHTTGTASSDDIVQVILHAVRMRKALMPLLHIRRIIGPAGGGKFGNGREFYDLTPEALQEAVTAIDAPERMPDWQGLSVGPPSPQDIANSMESSRILKKLDAERDAFSSDKVWRQMAQDRAETDEG